jgi:hypothetical protein
MRAVIASGSGRYADPWHPFPETSLLLAEILGGVGFAVEIDEDVDGAMTRLDGVDLLVVNAADPWLDKPGRLAPGSPGIVGLAAALDRGIGVIALHCAAATLRDYPDWAAAIGGMWVPGQSWHPPADVAVITPGTDAGDLLAEPFEVFDERYCSIQRIGRSRVVAQHEGPDGPEPTAWVREHGPSRIAVDLLGHDTSSYDSGEHRALVARLAAWAARA